MSIGYPGSEPRRPGEVKELAVAFVWVRPKQLRDEDIRVFYIVAGQASDDEEPGEDDGASDDAEDDTGAVLGDRFELLEAIAWGGTAAVYRARDRVTKAEVAVKVLCSGVRAQLGRYFGQEGRLAAQLCNPHLVRAHHFGVDDGRPFIVFDLVPGRSLPALYFKQPMPWRELCEVVLGLLDALGTMHAQGIVHRDVKPDNVVVWRRPNHPDHVTLLDVGFAAVPPERNMTNAPEPTRMVFGTHGYIAPELFAGTLPDPRNDLYSVGALMYEMLTSLPVTDLSNAPEILAIAPPRVVAPGAEIPESVEDVVMQALSDIDARFQSAATMAAAIRDALAPTPRLVEVEVVVAVPVPVPIPVEVSDPAEVHQAKRRTWLTPAALSLGIVLGGGGMFGLLSVRSDVPRESTVAVETPTAERGVARAALGNPDAVLTRSDLVAAPGSVATPSIGPEVPSRPGTDPPGEAITKKAADKPAATTPAIKKRVPAAPSPVHSFSDAMARLEPAVRRCAKENRVAQDPVNVEVRRGSGLDVDSVRVWDMSTQHPFARCVDKVIRGAPRLPKGAPVESFEFFDKPAVAEIPSP